MRKWLTPDLTWIHEVGLFPNVEAEGPENQPAGQDAVLDKGIEVVSGQLANPSATFPAPATAPPPTPSASPQALDDSFLIELSLATTFGVG